MNELRTPPLQALMCLGARRRAGRRAIDNEYIAYVPLIVAFSLIAAFVVAGRPFLTRPYAATTKVGAAESC